MAAISVGVGQCGASICNALATASDGERAQCVLVDSEPRALHAALRSGVPSSQCAVGEGGTGGNWAAGLTRAHARGAATSCFAGETGSATLVQSALEGACRAGRGGEIAAHKRQRSACAGVRRAAEQRCCSPHVLLSAGLSGGTGGGVGAALLEALRDELPTRYIVAVSATSCLAGPCAAINCVLAGSYHQARRTSAALSPSVASAERAAGVGACGL